MLRALASSPLSPIGKRKKAFLGLKCDLSQMHLSPCYGNNLNFVGLHTLWFPLVFVGFMYGGWWWHQQQEKPVNDFIQWHVWDRPCGTCCEFSKLHLVPQLCVRCDLLSVRVTRNLLFGPSAHSVEMWTWSLSMSDLRWKGHTFTSLGINSVS